MKQIKIGAIALLAITLLIFGLSGLVNIVAGEVGIKVKMIGTNTGMQNDTVPTGLKWINPVSYDVFVYDTRSHQKDVAKKMEAQTQDGQPVVVDISMEISLIAKDVPNLHQNIGEDYFARVIEPAFRSIARDSIATQRSDVVYTGKGRKAIGKMIENVLNAKLNKNGINIVINFRELDFVNKAFIKTLEQKAVAAQQEEIQRRYAIAASQEAIKVANIAEGQKQKVIKQAEAQAEKDRLQGFGERQQKEELAKGILAVGQAEAEVIRLRNAAMDGPGGDKIVSMSWAEHMGPNIKVYGIPTGSPGTTSMMDLNGLLKGAFSGMSVPVK